MHKWAQTLLTVLVLLLLTACSGGSGNPLLNEYDTPFGVPPFDQIKNEHFIPAFEEAMRQQEMIVLQIASDIFIPTFSNTIESFEYSDVLLDKVAMVFFNYSASNTSSEIQEIEEEISPMLSNHYDSILLNAKLFTRIKYVYDHKDEMGLASEQLRLLGKVYKYFAFDGALLPEDQKERFKEINQELSLLKMQFAQNLLNDVNDYKMVITNEEDLTSIPQSVIDIAAMSAIEEGFPGSWLFTLQNGSVMPFLSYDDNRELRHTMQQAYINRCNNQNEYDNKEILANIANLRLELANMLGHDNYAQYTLEDKMAGNIETVSTFLEQVWEPALKLAKQEALELQTFMDEEGYGFKLEQWDWRYYAEKLREEKYNLNEEEIRPYLELSIVRDGIFSIVNKLYGLQFIELKDIPKIYPDVQAFKVEEADGTYIGIIFMDLYSRDSKASGAWMSSYVDQYIKRNGVYVHPIVTLSFNFSKLAEGGSALLTRDEMITFFHEFGHGLHGLLSNVTYPSLSGTNVPRDFVELPSQIMENWARESTVLKTFARHYQTGEQIPQDILDRIEESANYGQGFSNVEILASTFLDMEYHTVNEPFAGVQLKEVPGVIERMTIDHIGLIPVIYFRHGSTHFSHIFAGGYAAGYYSYTWSGMLDADAFEAFRETGNFFNQKTAQSFRKNILEKGDTVEAMQMFINFRGREPQIEPLLRQRGLQ